MATDAKSPGVVIGENLRRLREEKGKRQDDVASAARDHGLRWSQATVAAIETGRREVSVGELLLLPVVLGSLGASVAVPDLLRTVGRVQLGPDAKATSDFVAAAFTGQFKARPVQDLDVPWLRSFGQEINGVLNRAQRATELAALLGYDPSWNDVSAAQVAAGQLVETRAATALGVEPLAVALAASKAWGHSLTVERDRRREHGGAKPRGSGGITRQLIAELRPALADAGLIKED